MGRRSASMHDAFGYPLVVEVGDLFAQMVILQKGRATFTRLQRMIGVVEPRSLPGGQVLVLLSARSLGPFERRTGCRAQFGRNLIRLGR